MPPLGSITGVEWLNQNSLRRYPLSDDASATDTTASFSLPNDLIVDLIIPIPSSEDRDPNGFHLSELAVFGQGVVIAFAYTDPTTAITTEIGRVAVGSSHVENTSYFINGVGAFSDITGKVVIGSLTETLRVGGVFTFDLAGGKLVPTTIRPDIRGISSLRIKNGAEISEPLYGDVELVAGANVMLAVDTSSNSIIVHGINGDDFDTDCSCLSTADRDLPPCIRTVNGVPPAANGNFQISTTGCIAITLGTGGLRLEDTCSKPCCTDSELQRIVSDQNALSAEVRTHGFTMAQLETRLIAMETLNRAIQATGFLGV